MTTYGLITKRVASEPGQGLRVVLVFTGGSARDRVFSTRQRVSGSLHVAHRVVRAIRLFRQGHSRDNVLLQVGFRFFVRGMSRRPWATFQVCLIRFPMSRVLVSAFLSRFTCSHVGFQLVQVMNGQANVHRRAHVGADNAVFVSRIRRPRAASRARGRFTHEQRFEV